MLFGQENTI